LDPPEDNNSNSFYHSLQALIIGARYVTEYGPNKERFKFTLFAVLAQSVMGALVARLGECRSDAKNSRNLTAYLRSDGSVAAH
jgi:hypothetical protein